MTIDPKDRDYNISNFCEDIFNKGILVKSLEIEFSNKHNTILTRVDGHPSMALSNNFLTSIYQQLQMLRDEILEEMIRRINSNFILSVKVDEQGKFLFNELEIFLKVDCIKRSNLHETFRTPFNVLMPFVEYIDYISLRGRDYQITVMEARISVSQEDLLEVLQYPIVGPAIKAQWYTFIIEINEEAKNEYKIDIEIPVHEGEIMWQIPQRKRMQLIEKWKRVVK